MVPGREAGKTLAETREGEREREKKRGRKDILYSRLLDHIVKILIIWSVKEDYNFDKGNFCNTQKQENGTKSPL